MQTLELFDSFAVKPPETQGVKYAGSKLRLLPYILQLAKKARAVGTVFDGFSGTTRVSQALAKSGYRVIANDVAEWSYLFGVSFLLNKRTRKSYQTLIDHLNRTPGKDGWFTEHYGGPANAGTTGGEVLVKRPWQIHNTRKLDGIRQEIERLCLEPIERAVAITSLILALDKVDSTLGHFVSYLKAWSPRSFKPLILEVPAIFVNEQNNEVLRGDVLVEAPKVIADIAYYDPPYGSNNEKMPPSRVRYAAYYHLWKTLCLYDSPELFGKANRRKDSSDRIESSPFEDFRRGPNGNFVAVEAINSLLSATRTPWVILSYGSGGRATAEELDRVVRANGELAEVVEISHRPNVMAGMRWTHEWVRDADKPNREFLFLIRR